MIETLKNWEKGKYSYLENEKTNQEEDVEDDEYVEGEEDIELIDADNLQ